MAKFVSSATDSVFKIEKFLGVNECPDGDTNLKMGEASNMQNFKITDNGALQLRGGTKSVAELLMTYEFSVADTATALVTEVSASTLSLTVSSEVAVLSGGHMIFQRGTFITMTYANHDACKGYYYNDGGTLYQFDDCVFADNTYYWNFKLATPTTNLLHAPVRSIWAGLVGGVEYIIAACGRMLWSLTETNGVWARTNIAEISTTNHVHLFGFDGKLYILDGADYRVWDGAALASVTGYRPLVLHATTPAGSGATFEGINKLNGLRRVRFSPDGTATTFQLPEKGLTSVDYAKKTADGSAVTFTADVATGIVTITPALTSGTDALEIGYTFPTTQRAAVIGMKYSETYNGQTDTRVFLYGDGSNKAFYTGIQFNTGKPSAEYFPDFNEIAVDKANSPITAMIKHYDRLLTFKTDGAFITTYGTITDAQNNTLAAFYTTPLNREIGNVAVGQAKLVKNNPFTLFGRSVYEWQLSSFSAKDERNAKRKSDRVSETLAGMTLTDAFCFDDEFHTEYYVVQGGTAVVYNYTTDAWYIYKNFPAVCMITYKQEVYFGTEDGYIRHVSRNYMNDNGAPIEAYWESGSMDFGAPHKRKYSRGLWLGIKPETSGEIKVTAITDKTSNLNEELSASVNTQTSASGFFSFLDLDFTTLSFGVSDMPRIDAHKIKAKKFTYYKLIFSSAKANTTATVTNAEISVRYTSNVR